MIRKQKNTKQDEAVKVYTHTHTHLMCKIKNSRTVGTTEVIHNSYIVVHMREWTEWRESTSKVNKIIQMTVDRTKSLSGVVKQTLYAHAHVQTAAATHSGTNVKDFRAFKHNT